MASLFQALRRLPNLLALTARPVPRLRGIFFSELPRLLLRSLTILALGTGRAALLFPLMLGAGRLLLLVVGAVAFGTGTAALLFPLILGAVLLLLIVEVAVAYGGTRPVGSGDQFRCQFVLAFASEFIGEDPEKQGSNYEHTRRAFTLLVLHLRASFLPPARPLQPDFPTKSKLVMAPPLSNAVRREETSWL